MSTAREDDRQPHPNMGEGKERGTQEEMEISDRAMGGARRKI